MSSSKSRRMQAGNLAPCTTVHLCGPSMAIHSTGNEQICDWRTWAWAWQQLLVHSCQKREVEGCTCKLCEAHIQVFMWLKQVSDLWNPLSSCACVSTTRGHKTTCSTRPFDPSPARGRGLFDPFPSALGSFHCLCGSPEASYRLGKV